MLNHASRRAIAIAPGLVFLFLLPTISPAGVINPDISLVGQPYLTWTDDPGDPDRLRLRPEIGETEVIFDAALNPYARGFATMSIGEDGLALEEGFFTLNRGLPLNLALKGGQYRVGFGRLNAVHPHAYPFADRFGVLAAYLPGEEAFNDVGLSLSRQFALPGDGALNLSADWLQGDVFRIARVPAGEGDPLVAGGEDDAGLTRAAWVARASGFGMLGEQSALDLGLTATGGTNNVAAGARSLVFGADAKAKLWTGSNSYLLLQGELLHLEREDASWDSLSGYATTDVDGTGGYVYADYNWSRRFNVGASYERFRVPGTGTSGSGAGAPGGEAGASGDGVESSIGAFVGLALLEETTAFRLDWRHVEPGVGEPFNRVNLRVIWSMGPHKAHQF
ncbi:MAG: hypothetical protein FD129_869 [bacterium]|nr:MAG: hypothetical protein FD129_869 [bacterium]